MTTTTSRREALRQQLRNEVSGPRPLLRQMAESVEMLARSQRTSADDAAAAVCRMLWTADRRTLQLLPPDVCVALNRWHEARQEQQTEEAASSAPKPRI